MENKPRIPVNPNIDLPRFEPKYPLSWLLKVEAVFHLAGIVDDETKFHLVTAFLPYPVLERFEMMLYTEQSFRNYTTLRKMIAGNSMLTYLKNDSPTSFFERLRFFSDMPFPKLFCEFMDKLPENIRQGLEESFGDRISYHLKEFAEELEEDPNGEPNLGTILKNAEYWANKEEEDKEE